MAANRKMQDFTRGTSTVGEFTFPYLLSDNESYIFENRIRGLRLMRFRLKVRLGYLSAWSRLARTLLQKKCYYGPFKGEFGHFLAHTLPFLMYLHKKGVRITYCGMELHKPFMVDESGNSIIHRFMPLRDFFAEVAPNTNSTVPPADVQKTIAEFESEAKKSGSPFWNIGDDYYYWFIHRHWLSGGQTYLYDLSKVYRTKNEKAVCIFPRNKGAATSHNNGGPWDYNELIEIIKPFVDKIYVVGHPSQSLQITPSEKVEIRVSADNRVILEACSNSRMIITQHSGVNNLGEYLRKQVLIIYSGGSSVSDIGSMNNTLLFRQYLNEKFPLKFAFTKEQVRERIKEEFYGHH